MTDLIDWADLAAIAWLARVLGHDAHNPIAHTVRRAYAEGLRAGEAELEAVTDEAELAAMAEVVGELRAELTAATRELRELRDLRTRNIAELSSLSEQLRHLREIMAVARVELGSQEEAEPARSTNDPYEYYREYSRALELVGHLIGDRNDD